MSLNTESSPIAAAEHFDFLQEALSLGAHRLWKRFILSFSGICQGQQVLDLAGGTGDLAVRLLKIVGSTGTVVLADQQADLLSMAREYAFNQGIYSIQYVQTSAETLPFPDHTFHCITVNLGFQQIQQPTQALQEMYRILKPGGRLLILAFTNPSQAWVGKLYGHYTRWVVPQLGRWLSATTKTPPTTQTTNTRQLKNSLQQAGFCRCDVYALSGGLVALHRGFKA